MAIPSVSHTPLNPNNLHPNKFIISFSAIPNLEYWAQSVNVPGVGIGEALRQTPFIDLAVPGDKMIMNPFSMTFIVDEDLLGWLEVYNWMRGLAFPRDFTEYQNLSKRLSGWASKTPQVSDAVLLILNSKQIPKMRVKFKNCYPTNVSDLLLSAASSPEDVVTADAIFHYDLYEIEKL